MYRVFYSDTFLKGSTSWATVNSTEGFQVLKSERAAEGLPFFFVVLPAYLKSEIAGETVIVTDILRGATGFNCPEYSIFAIIPAIGRSQR